MTVTDPRDALVIAQYDALPYPARDPKDEAKRLILGSPSALPEIEHWIFGGRLPARLRVLFAGGGTGDGCIMLAQQLADRQVAAEIVHLDLSAPAQAIAEARMQKRGLDNIRFVQGSLLAATDPDLDLGTFDYIDCCGVLHHLKSPEAGLTALASALAPGGGMGLMVYGIHGRAGVYEMQDILRLLSPLDEAPATRINIARRILDSLPATNALRRNPVVRDHVGGGDAGLYDLLLHPRDRAYEIEAFFALIEGADLTVASLGEPLRYAPETYLSDPLARKRALALGPRMRAVLAERLAGNIARHVAYVVRPDHPAPPPNPGNPAAIPIWWLARGDEMAQGIGRDRVLRVTLDGLALDLPLPNQAPGLLRLIDGQRNLGTIRDMLGERAFACTWPDCWRILNGLNRLYLCQP